MANLSNINNKFLVTTTGEVLIGGTAAIGAAKLQVTGEARVYTGSNLGYWGVDAGNSYVYLGTNSSGYGLSFQTSGTERMRIDASGNISFQSGAFVVEGDGILINNDDNLRLRFSESGVFKAGLQVATTADDMITGSAVNDFCIRSNFNMLFAAGSVERLRIDSSGNVKVGRSAGYGNSRIQSFIDSTANFATPAYLAADSTNMAQGVGGEISFIGKYATGVDDYAFYGGIKGFKENATSGNTACALGFYTRPTATLPTERMRIDSSGRVGIGTDNPARNLTIYESSGNAVLQLANSTSGVGASDGFLVFTDGTNVGLENKENGYLSLSTQAIERMRVSADGKVTIGNTAAVQPLTVAGNVLFRTSTADGFENRFQFIPGGSGDAGNFYVYNASETATIRLNSGGDSYFNGGNVGIGTATPAYQMTLCSNPNFHEAGLNTVMTTAANQQLRIISDAHGGGGRTSDIAFLTANTTTPVERMRITSGGDVLIDTTTVLTTSSTYGNLTLDGSMTVGPNLGALTPDASINVKEFGGKQISFFYGTTKVGGITSTSSATAYNTSSDYRLKEDLQDFAGLDMVSKIPVYDFKWKTDESRSYGVMAHELQEVLPQAVVGEKDAEEMQSVDYSKIVPLLVKSIQELTAKVEKLESTLTKCKCNWKY